jgi:outer membrane receptor protein involved in Fe transport
MNHGLSKTYARLSGTRVRLASGAAILALSAGAAMAQEGVEQVIVSSTRLQAAGFDAPTPTTVIGAADIQAQAKPSVFDTLTNLPAVQGSTGAAAQAGTTSNGLIGLSAIGLRGLSPLRTLVLIDSQRFVAANLNGTVDVSMMPQMLIQRVDIVTGGASAAWGSDAVAGVVNFVTDKKFEGFKLNAVAGLSGYGDMGNVTFQTAAGTSFAGGRGHFEVAGEYSYNDGLLPRYPQSTQHTGLPGNIDGRDLSRTSGMANYGSTPSQTPAGQPQTFYGPLRMQTQFAAYGLVQNGPKAGFTFGSDMVAYPEPLAGGCTRNATGGLVGAIGGICFGTPTAPGDTVDTREFTQGLINPLTRGSLYMRASYDLTPNTEIYATLTYSGVRTENTPAQGNSDKSGFIHCDNAYLPQTNLFGANLTAAQTLAACLAAYPTPAGKNIFDNGVGIPFGSNWANILTDQNMHIYRQTRRFVAGGDGVHSVRKQLGQYPDRPEHAHLPPDPPLRGGRGRRLRSVRQAMELEFLFRARRKQHQRQDLQHAAVEHPGEPRDGQSGQHPAFALQPGAGRDRQFRRQRCLPQHPRPDLRLRALQSLRQFSH